MTSMFDDGAPDWAPEYETTMTLDDDVVLERDDVEPDGSLASADEQDDGDAPTEAPRFGGSIAYEELSNPDTGNSLEWEVSEGWTDAGTGEPVDYWQSDST